MIEFVSVLAAVLIAWTLADSLADLLRAWADRIRYKTERLRFELNNVKEVVRVYDRRDVNSNACREPQNDTGANPRASR